MTKWKVYFVATGGNGKNSEKLSGSETVWARSFREVERKGHAWGKEHLDPLHRF